MLGDLNWGIFDAVTVLGTIASGLLYVLLSAYFFPDGLMRVLGLLLSVRCPGSTRARKLQRGLWRIMDFLDTRAKMQAAMSSENEADRFAAVTKLSQIKRPRVAAVLKRVAANPELSANIRRLAQSSLSADAPGSND